MTQKSPELMLQEMDAAGVTMGVIPGRNGHFKGTIANDDIIKLLDDFPGRFVGTAGLNASKKEEALEEMDRILDQGHMESLKMALYFFEYLNRMDEDALEAKGLEREDLQEKILEAADRFGYRSMAEMLL